MNIPPSELAVDRILDALDADLLTASEQEIREVLIVGLASTPKLEVVTTIAEVNAALVERLPGAGFSHLFSKPKD